MASDQPRSGQPQEWSAGAAGQELVQLYLEFQAYKQTGQPLSQFNPSDKMLRVQNGMVGVDVRGYGDVNAFATALSDPSIGMQIQTKDATNRIVEGYVPIDKLTAVASLQKVVNGKTVQTVGIDPNVKPIVSSVGAANNQAEDVFGLPQALQQFPGITGSGVTVGVLSDSANRYANGLSDSISTGDLPPLNRINVLQDEPVGGPITPTKAAP